MNSGLVSSLELSCLHKRCSPPAADTRQGVRSHRTTAEAAP